MVGKSDLVALASSGYIASDGDDGTGADESSLATDYSSVCTSNVSVSESAYVGSGAAESG